MKTYSSLSIDVIHFEAQDVITSSIPSCSCTISCFAADGVFNEHCDGCRCDPRVTEHQYPG